MYIMIIISPKSNGLGNQLFNIFAGIQYAKKIIKTLE